jgi:hypothetical protein
MIFNELFLFTEIYLFILNKKWLWTQINCWKKIQIKVELNDHKLHLSFRELLDLFITLDVWDHRRKWENQGGVFRVLWHAFGLHRFRVRFFVSWFLALTESFHLDCGMIGQLSGKFLSSYTQSPFFGCALCISLKLNCKKLEICSWWVRDVCSIFCLLKHCFIFGN